MKQAFACFINFTWNDEECNILFYHMTLKWYLIAFTVDIISMKTCIVILDSVMMLQVPPKVLCKVWSYHIYYMTLATE